MRHSRQFIGLGLLMVGLLVMPGAVWSQPATAVRFEFENGKALRLFAGELGFERERQGYICHDGAEANTRFITRQEKLTVFAVPETPVSVTLRNSAADGAIRFAGQRPQVTRVAGKTNLAGRFIVFFEANALGDAEVDIQLGDGPPDIAEITSFTLLPKQDPESFVDVTGRIGDGNSFVELAEPPPALKTQVLLRGRNVDGSVTGTPTKLIQAVAAVKQRYLIAAKIRPAPETERTERLVRGIKFAFDPIGALEFVRWIRLTALRQVGSTDQADSRWATLHETDLPVDPNVSNHPVQSAITGVGPIGLLDRRQNFRSAFVQNIRIQTSGSPKDISIGTAPLMVDDVARYAITNDLRCTARGPTAAASFSLRTSWAFFDLRFRCPDALR